MKSPTKVRHSAVRQPVVAQMLMMTRKMPQAEIAAMKDPVRLATRQRMRAIMRVMGAISYSMMRGLRRMMPGIRTGTH